MRLSESEYPCYFTQDNIGCYVLWSNNVSAHRQTGNMYKNVKKKIEKGIAFPTSVSVNNAVCHFSPLASDETLLEDGDIVKM